MTGNKHWSADERRNLQAHYPAIANQRLTELFPSRTARAITHQATNMGIKKCQERLREMGRENVEKRWSKVFKAPDSPTQ